MIKHVLILLFFISVISCKTADKLIPANESIIFSLKSTSCMGECPVYNLSLNNKYVLTFNGIEHTQLKGNHSKKLTDEEKTKITALIDEVGWVKLKKEYVSKMLDLPSYTFKYNSKGIDKIVFQYGADPEFLNKLRKSLLEIVYQKDFF